MVSTISIFNQLSNKELEIKLRLRITYQVSHLVRVGCIIQTLHIGWMTKKMGACPRLEFLLVTISRTWLSQLFPSYLLLIELNEEASGLKKLS